MGQSNNHNYSIETQFEVVTRAGKLPTNMLHKTPGQFSAGDEYELSKIFDTLVNDNQFKNWLKKAVDKIDDREDLRRSREVPRPPPEEDEQPSLFDTVVEVAEDVAIGVAVGSLLGGSGGEADTPSQPEWSGGGGEFSGAGASGDFGGSDE